MTEPEKLHPESRGEETPTEQPPFVPSPVSRRIWAWMGVAYMLLIIALMTYWIATSSLLQGITGIMLFPLLGALGINNARLCRRGERGGSFALLSLTAALMGLLALATLALGIFQLLGAWGV